MAGVIQTAGATHALETENTNAGEIPTAGVVPAFDDHQPPAIGNHSPLDTRRYLQEIESSTCSWRLSTKAYLIVDDLFCHEHFVDQSDTLLLSHSKENVHSNILDSGITKQVYYCVACTPVNKYKHVTLTRWCSLKRIYCYTCNCCILIPNHIMPANSTNNQRWQSAFTYLNNTNDLTLTLIVFRAAQRSSSRDRVGQQSIDTKSPRTAHHYR